MTKLATVRHFPSDEEWSLLTRGTARPATPTGGTGRHLLTVALEDYYQVGAFNHLIQQRQWHRFEHRLERGARHTLDLLDEFGVSATFFIMGWVAEAAPELVREVAERGHEIASRGFYHRSIGQMTPSEFREDLSRTREALERAAGRRVLGYRVADAWFGPRDLWALDVLNREGYAYDSSVGPLLRRFHAEPWRRFAHLHRVNDRDMWEFPISTVDLLGWMVPIAGGNYFRQLPHWFVRRAVASWMEQRDDPFLMYFHSWELDPDQPRISAAPMHSRIRQYRNLERMPEILRYYLERYRFTSIADHLGLDQELTSPARRPTPPAATPGLRLLRRTPVTIVVPCHNEEQILSYLANTLKTVEGSFAPRYELEYVFVDDGSSDDTWEELHRRFGTWSNARFIRHERNRGVAAAILTGLREAKTEVVCSIDCDCTYDPHQLAGMIPLLTGGVAMVTASPYHPEGTVRNVPAWRLFLSRGLSRLYRLLLRHPLSTHTSCVRVYRRDAALSVRVRSGGFLGVAEHLARLDLAGYGVREFPATLEVRLLGRSKMKLTRTIAGHLLLLVRLAGVRLFTRPSTRPVPS